MEPLKPVLSEMTSGHGRFRKHARCAGSPRCCSRPCSIDTDRSCREADPERFPNAIPLSSLHPGQTGKFAYSLKEGGSASTLCEIGLMPGTIVELLRAAPLWGPVMVRVRGTDIALGNRMAKHIFVELTGVR